VIEEEIEVVVLTGDFEMILAADEREPLAELEDQRAQMFDQPSLKIPLQHFGSERQEIEAIGVFENLLREFGLPGRAASW
jgi:hypothetical protein